MNLQDASLDIEGLFQLAEGGGWRRIVMYSNTMLADPTISKSIDLHKILMIRFYALFKLKLFDDLSQELGTSKGFGTNDHQLVAIKVLEAEIKVVTGRGNEAVEHMYTIINELEDIFTTSNSLKVFWKFVITGNVVNAILRMRNWKAAIDELQKLVESIEETLDRCHSVNDRHFYSSSLMIVLMRMALIHMQVMYMYYYHFYYCKGYLLLKILEHCDTFLMYSVTFTP